MKDVRLDSVLLVVELGEVVDDDKPDPPDIWLAKLAIKPDRVVVPVEEVEPVAEVPLGIPGTAPDCICARSPASDEAENAPDPVELESSELSKLEGIGGNTPIRSDTAYPKICVTLDDCVAPTGLLIYWST